MADNDQDDEYKFNEYDSFNNESIDNTNYGLDEAHASEPTTAEPPKKNVMRNALLAVGLIILAMLAYKLLGGLFSGKNRAVVEKEAIPAAPVAQMAPQPAPVIVTPQPVQQVQPAPSENNSLLNQKVDSIENNQQNLQSQVSSVNEQVSNVNNNVNNLSSEINKLNQLITDLTHQVSRQSDEINTLMARTKPKPIKHIVRPQQVVRVNVYHINAVIPGRAWLIGTNGSTLTVREGTKIPGYGTVRLIDAMQGRVLTSSGRIIRFSQEDS